MCDDDDVRSVLVTGSSSGIGEATAMRLAHHGWRVFAGVRRGDDGDRLADAAPGIEPVIVDVVDEGTIECAVRFVRTRTGGSLDGLVNNAGVAVGGPIEGLELDEWRRQFEVNVFGQIAVTRASLALLRGSGGRVVFVSSNSGIVSTPLLGPYCASKHALEAVGFALREELRPQGISVSMVLPGAIATSIWDKADATVGRLENELPAEIRHRYAEAIERTKRTITAQALAGIPADEVAATVEKALTARRPRPRYYVGMDARSTVPLVRFLPSTALGWVLRRLDIA